MNQLQLAIENLQDAWAALIDTFADVWEKIKDVVSDAWAALTNLFCFWKAQNSEEQNRIAQSRIELFDSTELFLYNNSAD